MRELDNWLESFIKYTEQSEPPEIFRLWVAVSVIATVLQRKSYINWVGPTYSNEYIILVASGGRARKGVAMSFGRYFLDKMGDAVILAAESPTRQALIRRMKLAERSYPSIDGKGLSYHSSITVYSDEFTVFLGDDKKMIPNMCNWYDCPHPWRYDTKDEKKVDYVRHVWLNLLAGTTPENLRQDLPPETVGSGLLSRIIFVYAQDKGKTILVPPDINTSLLSEDLNLSIREELSSLRDSLTNDLFRIAQLRGEFRVTDDFIPIWKELYKSFESNPLFTDSPLVSYNERRPKHLLKLCMILSAAQRDDMTLTGADLRTAFEILERTEQTMSLAFAGVGKSDIASIIARVSYAVSVKKEVLFSQLATQLYYDADVATLTRVVSDLRTMGKLTTERTPGGKDILIKYVEG